jgi:hypothetical protein
VVGGIHTLEEGPGEGRESIRHTGVDHLRNDAYEVEGGSPLLVPHRILDKAEVGLRPFVVARLDDAIDRREKRWWDHGGCRWVLHKDGF